MQTSLSRFVGLGKVAGSWLPSLGITLGLASALGGAYAQGAGAEWTTPAGTVQGTRFSTLDAINAGNVATLVEDFTVPSGVKAGHEGQPLVVGSTMYMRSEERRVGK